MDEVQEASASQEVPTYGEKLSPYAQALMKSLGGSPLSHRLTPKQMMRWAVDRPESVVNMLSEDPEIAEATAKLPQEILRQTETELRGKYPMLPSRRDRRARLMFWEEYEEAAKKAGPISLTAVAGRAGLVSWASYREELLANLDLLGWFMTPPPEYQLQLKEAQEMGLARLMDILELPAKDPVTGKLAPAVLALQLRAWQLIDMRVNGAVTQKTVHMHGEMGPVPTDGVVDVKALDEQLAKLEKVLAGTPLSIPPAGALPEQAVEAEVVCDDSDS